MSFYIGQIFDGEYPVDAAMWCNENNAYIEELEQSEDEKRKFQIKSVPEPTIEEIRNNKLSEINNKYNIATESLVSTYPATELLTFDKQEQEARMYMKDDSSDIPFLKNLAESRGIELDDLVQRVIKKADTFSNAVSILTGQRQKYEDMLDVATNVEEIEAIVPEYKMPET